MLTSEGIPKDSWKNDAMIMKGRYLKDCRVKSSVSVEDLLMWKREALEKITSLFNQSTKPIGEEKIRMLQVSYSIAAM